MEWQTLINLQAGTHIPYFPGMDWDKVERYEWQGLTGRQRGMQKAREKMIEKGDSTRAFILDTFNQFVAKYKEANVSDISDIVGLSYYHTGRILRKLYQDGVIDRKQVEGYGCKTYLYFPK